eukprot:scaffold4885_cov157-Skeletonema_marinoi.AAC.3
MTTKHSEVGASQIALQAATPQTAGITVAWAGLQPKTPSHITREAVQGATTQPHPPLSCTLLRALREEECLLLQL